jgi:hypothetical protein
MQIAFHTRSQGKQLTYRIEYDADAYKIFLRTRFLKMGAAERDPQAPRWAGGGPDALLRRAIEDIEQLRDMPET